MIFEYTHHSKKKKKRLCSNLAARMQCICATGKKKQKNKTWFVLFLDCLFVCIFVSYNNIHFNHHKSQTMQNKMSNYMTIKERKKIDYIVQTQNEIFFPYYNEICTGYVFRSKTFHGKITKINK